MDIRTMTRAEPLQTIAVRVDPALLRELDEVARREDRSRASAIRVALQELVRRRFVESEAA